MEKVKMELESYTKMGKDGKEITKQRYPKLYGKHRKEQKRTEAGERKKAWDKLTLEQKWDALGQTESEKHRARLMKEMKA